MSSRRALAAFAAILATVFSSSACSDDGGDSSDDEPSSSSPDDTSPDDTSPDGSEGEGTEAEGEPSEAIDVCTVLTAEQVGAALGGTVTAEEIPGGGCNFSNADDPRSPSAAFNQSTVDDVAGGFEGTRQGVTSIVEGEVQDLPDVGDDAFFVVGPALGSTSITGSGAVLLGDQVVQLTLLQSQELTEPEVGQLTIDVLTLVGDLG